MSEMNRSEIPKCSGLVQSSRVNKKIVEYYLKYAKDRDIERFMRLSSSSNPSKSSSSGDSECVIAFQQLEVCCTDRRKNAPKKEQPSPKHDTATQTPEKEEAGNLTAPDSITKNGKRLEWDSLGDVGYKKASSTGNLSSLERSVLKELFNESPSEPNISQQERDTSSADAQTRKERWRQTLENLGKKYSSVDGERGEPTQPQFLSRQKMSDKREDSASSSSVKGQIWKEYSSVDSQLFMEQGQKSGKKDEFSQTRGTFSQNSSNIKKNGAVSRSTQTQLQNVQSSSLEQPQNETKSDELSQTKDLSSQRPSGTKKKIIPLSSQKGRVLTNDSEPEGEFVLKVDRFSQIISKQLSSERQPSKEKEKKKRLSVDSELFLEQGQNEQEVVPNVETSSEKELKGFLKQLPSGINAVTTLSSLTDPELWTHPWDEFGDKYSSTSYESQLLLELPQSTPIIVPSSDKYCQTSNLTRVPRRRMKDRACQMSLEQIKPQEEDFGSVTKEDHFCQTSFDKIKPQVDYSDKRRTFRESISHQKEDHSCQTSFDKINPQVESFDERGSHLESNSRYVDHSVQTSLTQISSKRPSIAEKICQTSIPKLQSQEVQASILSRTDSFATQSSFEYHVGGADSTRLSAKRRILSEVNNNTRPLSDSDKENQLEKKPHKPKTEVDLGIKLLCSLIEAKNLSSTQKKNLAKKIFEKIMKQHASASTSTSITSRSSAFSGQSIIEDFQPPDEFEKSSSESMLVEESKSIRQMTEETQTEDQNVYQQPPTSSSSSREEPTTMREWLHPLTRSEKDYDKKHKKNCIKELSPQTTERSRQLTWIETEINRLEGLKNLLIQERSPKSRSSTFVSSKSTIQSGGRAEVIFEESAEDIVKQKDQYKRTTRRASQNVIIYDEPTTADGDKQPKKVGYKTTKVIVDEERPMFTSASLKNRRSKLETPCSSSTPSPDCQSVSAFASQLQKQFMQNYTNKQRCVSEHYSEPRICGKPIFTRNPSYTSVASSAFCMSSEMSIPIVESSSTTTTTHQYDSHGCDSVGGVAVQTTYSVIKTDPIFGPRCRCICTCGKECKCSCPRPTVRVSGKAYHQTVQVKPKALAYVIRFTETTDSEGNKLTEECMTLQQRLEMYNPNFCSKADQRQDILKKLHQLRQEREQQIREIAENSNISSVSRKLEQLPPPPIKNVRICATKEMKGMTKKRYSKLPEVVAKQEREKLERRKRTTRMITHIFNKKLQRMVHKGKMSLEYSRTVI